MKKGFLSKVLVLIMILSVVFPMVLTRDVLASGATLPTNIVLNTDIDIQMTHDDVTRAYSKHQGEFVVVDEIILKQNGDAFYYTGRVHYIGRNGFFGSYQYLGSLKNDFNLIKIVKANGEIITPSRIKL